MLADVVALLRCPLCGAASDLDARVLRCRTGHAFDVARQGYVNLLPGDARTGTADTAAMVAARAAFLGAGHYAPLTRAIADAAAATDLPADGCVLDLGAGTGHHLAGVLDALPGRSAVALDLSKHAARRLARAHPRIGAAVCDVWRQLPVRDGVAALALSVFAPRNGHELARAVAPGGALLVVTPTQRHLQPLVQALDLLRVDDDKRGRLRRQLEPAFALEAEAAHAHRMRLDAADVAAVVGMGPSARHTDPAALPDRIAALATPLTVTAAVRIACYRRT